MLSVAKQLLARISTFLTFLINFKEALIKCTERARLTVRVMS